MGKAEQIFEDMTSKFIEAIEAGQAGDWSKPWIAAGDSLPHNATTGKQYRGANVLALWIAADTRGYSGTAWATYKQWQSVGAQVRKGEKGTSLVKWVVAQCKDHGSDVSCTRCGRMFPTGFTVFHSDQVDGYVAPEVEELTVTERDERADAWFAAIGADVRHEAGDRACYSPVADRITMPLADQFIESDGYYATLAHEHGHWTGHTSRLDRDLTGRFGSDSYAMEELVAELTSAFVCATLGVSQTPRQDHAAYLAHWATVCKADSRALWAAASHAQKALDHLVELAGVEVEEEVVAA